MGRWTFPEGGQPLYVPDAGEKPGGGGGLLGHLGMGIGSTFEDLTNSRAARLANQVLGAPARAVTAVGHSLDPAGYQGTTDPIDYIMTGEKRDDADLAHYGDLLADTMAAEGTIDEKGLASKAVRAAGDLISDPLILAGVARGVARVAAKPARAPGLRDRAIKPNIPAPAKPKAAPKTKYRQPPADRPSPASQWPSVPMDQDLAAPGVFTRDGVGRMPRGRGTVYRGEPLDADLVPPGAPAGPGRMSRAGRGTPPAAARPLDQDLAYGRGGVRGLPQTKAAKAKGRKLKRATRKMKDEQLQEGVGKMKAEQLDQGVRRMNEEATGMRPGSMGPEATQPIWMTDPAGTPVSRGQVRALIQSAVENGASADDVMTLMSNLIEPPVIPAGRGGF